MRTVIPLLVVSLAGTALAQTVSYIAPTGSLATEGDSNNTIPWWSASATYQQVHDATDMRTVLPGPAALIRGLSFRRDGTPGSLAGRTLDVEITLGTTPTTAANVSSLFASNLGPAPMVTLPFTNVNLPLVNHTTTPNPQGWFFPFSTPFPYAVASGNLCWEMRTRNSSSNTSAACDAVSSFASHRPLFGTGCIATGQTSPATIGVQQLIIPTGQFRNRLDAAARSTAAVLFLGVIRQRITLPGLCSDLETLPSLNVGGLTDATGTWDFQATLGSLIGQPSASIYSQFVFVDAGLPLGLGFSTCAEVVLPNPVHSSLSRIWAAPYNSGNGNESATFGFADSFYGLVTGFEL